MNNDISRINNKEKKWYLPTFIISKRRDSLNGPSFCLNFMGFFIRGFLSLQFHFNFEISLREITFYVVIGYIQIGFTKILIKDWYKLRMNTFFDERKGLTNEK